MYIIKNTKENLKIIGDYFVQLSWNKFENPNKMIFFLKMQPGQLFTISMLRGSLSN